LILSNNQLSGTIPSLEGLEYLFLNKNQFTGNLPTNLGSYINVLDVSNNQLSGTLSKKVLTSYSWQGLFLSYNNFSGTFPSLSSSTLSGMYLLAANNNQFSGAIPTTVGDLAAIVSLDFSHNAFTGAIPTGISKLYYSIANLRFANNELSGSVPNLFDSLQFLYRLDISNNKYNFTGMSNVASLSSWITNDVYAPQALVKLDTTGGKLSVTVGDQLKNNTYNWYDASGLVKTITGDSTFTPTVSGSYYVAATNVNAPDLTLYSDTVNFTTPLPITLLNFLAVPSGKDVLVSWHTATELNTSHFNVQHGTDAVNFTDLGSVKAVGSGANSYQFTDLAPAKGINYYRLQSVDNNGAFSYSKVVSVQFTVDGLPFTLFPNPVKDITRIQGSHIASVQVMDNLGRIISTQTLNDATNPAINASVLQAGAYYLRIQTTDGKVSVVGFVKK